MFKIYGWRNIYTDEWYVGQTRQLLKYRANQGKGYRGSIKFNSAIKKYGWSAFEENILRICTTKEEADHWEIFYIQKLNSIERGYNTTKGGKGLLGFRFTEESNRKRSESLMGHEVSEETRRKISECQKGEKHPLWGKHLPEETRKRISEAHGVNGVLQLSRENFLLNEFPSIREAERRTGVKRKNIIDCCKGRIDFTGDFTWRYA